MTSFEMNLFVFRVINFILAPKILTKSSIYRIKIWLNAVLVRCQRCQRQQHQQRRRCQCRHRHWQQQRQQQQWRWRRRRQLNIVIEWELKSKWISDEEMSKQLQAWWLCLDCGNVNPKDQSYKIPPTKVGFRSLKTFAWGNASSTQGCAP